MHIISVLNDIDYLKIYSGDDFYINPSLSIKQPTLGDIKDYGEQSYYSMVYTLCSVGADLKWQLDDMGLNYVEIADYDLFCDVLSKMFTTDRTSILFGDVIDFSKMKSVILESINEKVLMQELDDGFIVIDRLGYSAMVEVLRYMHGIKRNDEIPGTEVTRQIFIEEARENYKMNKDKPFKSVLLPMISAMVNSSGFKYDSNTVFNMKICPFMDSVKRISKIKHADVLLQSAYSGFGVDIKKVDKQELNWMGELN